MGISAEIIKKVINEVGVTWGDATKLVTKAKSELGGSDDADAIVAKCKEYTQASDFKKTPKPEVPTYDSLKEARSSSIKASSSSSTKPATAAAGASAATDGDQRSSLSFLTPNYPPPTKSKLKEEAEAAVAARNSASGGAAAATAAAATTAVATTAAATSNGRPVPSKVPTTSWVRDLVQKLDLTWSDATKVLSHACAELEIPAGTYPEERKDEVFERATAIVAAEDFERSAKPTPISYKDLERQRLAAMGMTPKGEDFNDEVQAVEKTVQDEEQIRKRNALIAIAAVLVIIIVIIASVVGTRDNRDDDSGDSSNADVVTAAPTTVGTDGDCVASTKEFYVDDAIVVSFAVNSNITSAELDYAGAVLQKTYDALLAGTLAGTDFDSYCDPYCREITSISISNQELVEETNGVLNETFTEAGCDALLDMTFAVYGTYLACDGEEFPGLFDTTTTETGTSSEQARGADRVRQLVGEKLRSSESVKAQDDVQSLLRGKGRHLEEVPEGTCGAECPSDTENSGLAAPSTSVIKEVFEPFVTVLQPICGVVDVSVPSQEE